MRLLLGIAGLLCGGRVADLARLIAAVIIAITMIRLPIASAHLKLARASLFPVGSEIVLPGWGWRGH